MPRPYHRETPKVATERQAQVWRFVADHMLRHGLPPTMRDIGETLGIRSTNGVMDHLRALVRKGYIELRGQSTTRRVSVKVWPPIQLEDYGPGTHLAAMVALVRAADDQRAEVLAMEAPDETV